jgi:hypothetical protein
MTGLMILLVFFLCLIAMSLVYGFRKHIGLDFIIEINMLSSPYHHFGVSFFGEDEGKYLVEKLVIGFIFFNIVIHFYKHRDEN